MNQLSRPSCRLLVALLVISVLGGVIYSNTLSTPFIFDDVRNISENASVRWDTLSWEQFRQTVLDPPAHVTKRRPLSFVSFGLNHYFGGRHSVTGYHLVNIVIHVVNGMLVYLLVFVMLRRLGGGRPDGFGSIAEVASAGGAGERCALAKPLCDPFIPALVAGCVFVAHPIQTQAVTYIVQRMTSMAVLFYLSALLFHIHGCLATTKTRRWLSWGACLVSWLLALGTKEIAITLPAAIVLVEWFFFRGGDRAWLKRALAWIAIGVIVLGVLYGVGWYLSSGRTFMSFQHRDFSMAQRLLTQPRVVLFYISLVLLPLPSRLNLLHHVPVSQSLFNPPTVLLSILAIVALLAVAVWLVRRAPLISFGIVWFFLHLALESSVLPLEMVYEHRVYLPLFGVTLIVAYLVQILLSRGQVWVAVPIVLIVASLGVATFARNQVWRDRVALWSDVIDKSPLSARAFNNRALIYAQMSDWKSALADYSKSIKLDGKSAKTYSNRGIVHQSMGNDEDALKDYMHAIQLDSDIVEAYNNRGMLYKKQGKHQLAIDDFSHMIRRSPGNAVVYNNRGDAYRKMNRNRMAVADYTQAIKLDPYAALGYINRANAYRAMGRSEDAIRDYTNAIKVAPNSSELYNNRGTVHMAMGSWNEAANDFGNVIRLNPADAGGHNNLAWLLATCPEANNRDGNKAVKHGRRALELTGENNVSTLDTLAAAYAEAGQFAEAVKSQARAVSLVPPQAKADLQKRLDLYKQGKPFRMRRSQ